MSRAKGMYASPVVLPSPSTAAVPSQTPVRLRVTHTPSSHLRCPSGTDDIFKIIGRGGRVRLQKFTPRTRRP